VDKLGPLTDAARTAVDEAMAIVPRIWDRDHTVWGEDPTEISDRLGWLEAPERADEVMADLQRIATSVIDDGVTDVLLVGMGGSSLYPLVLSTVFGPMAGHPRLWVLDSTDPAAVLEIENELPWAATLVVPASKSGGTVETISHLDRFLARLVDAHGPGDAGRFVLPITDPGSALAARASSDRFRGVVHGQPDVGGRFSALTPFGLLPATLLGLDPTRHLEAARTALAAAAAADPQVNGPAVLGAVLAAAAREGRDKLTLLLPEEIASFGLWIEQLIAESTGKHGVGILPVLGETLDNATFGDDRLVVSLGEHDAVPALVEAGVPVFELPWEGRIQLAGEVVRFEVATAVAGALLGINPFDQPDVASAKAATGRVLEAGEDLPATEDPATVLGTVAPGDYIGILGFVTPDTAAEAALYAAAERLRAAHGVPVTVGVGPRYLHSTGQLHKGGPDRGVFLLAVGDDPQDADVPGAPFTFSQLKRAQAAGDLEALRAAGRRVALVRLEDL
jgi:transaldolase/glucose-6-phosphate isomerase